MSGSALELALRCGECRRWRPASTFYISTVRSPQVRWLLRQICDPCQQVLAIAARLRTAARKRWQATRALVLERSGHRCQVGRCRRRAITVDHIWPASKGGTDDPANLRAACRRCNSRKGAAIPSGMLPLFVEAQPWNAAELETLGVTADAAIP